MVIQTRQDSYKTSFDVCNYVCYALLHVGLKWAFHFAEIVFLKDAVKTCTKLSKCDARSMDGLLLLRRARAMLHQHIHKEWSAFVPFFSTIALGAIVLDGVVLYATLSQKTFLGAFWWYMLGMLILATVLILKMMATSFAELCRVLDVVDGLFDVVRVRRQNDLDDQRDNLRILEMLTLHKQRETLESRFYWKDKNDDDFKREIEDTRLEIQRLEALINDCMQASAFWATQRSPCQLYVLPGILPTLTISTAVIRRNVSFQAPRTPSPLLKQHMATGLQSKTALLHDNTMMQICHSHAFAGQGPRGYHGNRRAVRRARLP